MAGLRLGLRLRLGLGVGGGCLWDSRVRPRDKEPLGGLLLWGHSLASFSLAGGWPQSDMGVRRRGLAWVEEGVLGRGQLERGTEGGTSREGLCSP